MNLKNAKEVGPEEPGKTRLMGRAISSNVVRRLTIPSHQCRVLGVGLAITFDS
jgi:hypothetical protein